MIQEEWEESMRQLETMLSILILPFFGRWYGRRWAYWGELLHTCGRCSRRDGFSFVIHAQRQKIKR